MRWVRAWSLASQATAAVYQWRPVGPGQAEAGLGQSVAQGVFMSHMTQAVEAGPADYRPLVQAGSQAVHQSTANTTLDPCRSSPLDVLYWQHNTYTQLLST